MVVYTPNLSTWRKQLLLHFEDPLNSVNENATNIARAVVKIVVHAPRLDNMHLVPGIIVAALSGSRTQRISWMGMAR
jgi:hypothetical protein